MRITKNSMGRWVISAHHIATGMESEVALDVLENDGLLELWRYRDDDSDMELFGVYNSADLLMEDARTILPKEWRA